jgi:hypothetical protein
MRKLYNRPEGRIWVNLVVTADPHRAPGAGGAVQKLLGGVFKPFPDFSKWLNFYQTFDQGSLRIPKLPPVSLIGGTVIGATNTQLKKPDFIFPPSVPAATAADWTIHAHVGIPAVTKVTDSITKGVAGVPEDRASYGGP